LLISHRPASGRSPWVRRIVTGHQRQEINSFSNCTE
jgi:hypothetical protein